MWRLGSALAFLLLCCVGAGRAHAQAPLDLVELTNGGFLRGSVLAYEPGQPVVVQLPDGTTRTLAATEVARVRLGGVENRRAIPQEPPPETPALAPAGETEHAEPTPEPAVEPSAPAVALAISAPELDGGVWRMYDGSGNASPWPDLERPGPTHPVLHFGLAAGVGVNHRFAATYEVGNTTGARVEVAVFLDVRPVQRALYRFRVEGVLGFMNNDPRFGIVSFLARLYPLGLDLGDYVTWRLGATLGGRYADNWGRDRYVTNMVLLEGGPCTEVALTLLDRRFEIGALFELPVVEGRYSGAVIGLGATLRASYLF